MLKLAVPAITELGVSLQLTSNLQHLGPRTTVLRPDAAEIQRERDVRNLQTVVEAFVASSGHRNSVLSKLEAPDSEDLQGLPGLW